MTAAELSPRLASGFFDKRQHPIRSMIIQRVAVGILILLGVSMIVFLATEILPGNAAVAILGREDNPARLHYLERQFHLNESIPAQYWRWLSNLLSGNLGNSLSGGESVWTLVYPKIINSAVLAGTACLISSALGITLGCLAGLRRGTKIDHAASMSTLLFASLPEFVVGIVLVALFSVSVFHWLPGVSYLAPGQYIWTLPKLAILPVATLVLVTAPYLIRMTRASVIDTMESDYVEMAILKGLPRGKVIRTHVLPNITPTIVQVIGLNLLYLAGAIVIVENVFNFPGLGSELVTAIGDRDLPVIQFVVLVLAFFYVVVNIVTDVIALAASPRRRLPR